MSSYGSYILCEHTVAVLSIMSECECCARDEWKWDTSGWGGGVICWQRKTLSGLCWHFVCIDLNVGLSLCFVVPHCFKLYAS